MTAVAIQISGSVHQQSGEVVASQQIGIGRPQYEPDITADALRTRWA